ncbi:MAG: GerMN domain-containing protein [Paenibacillaceae bacterium]
MKRIRFIHRLMFVGLVSFPLVLSGCGWFGAEETGSQIDPPQVDYELGAGIFTDVVDEEVMAEPEQLAPVTLYFKDAQGYVAPIGLRIPAKEGIAKLALEYMVEGGPAEDLLPSGFHALLPKGTTIVTNVTKSGLAIVDFSENFTQYNPQDERKILEAVTWALTGFKSVNQVEIWVAGKALKQMPVDGTPLDEPLTRAMGINLERAQGVNPALASAVTLYFQGQNEDNYTYYVPVTRLVPYTDNMIAASVRELVKGPVDDSQLYSVMPASTEILNVEQKDDTVIVNFGPNIVGSDQKVSSGSLQALVLSLTELIGVPKVQIMVDGQAAVVASDHVNYTTPVSRPAQVNPQKL